MPITTEKVAALKQSIALALNPPEPSKLTPEEFGAYIQELTELAHQGDAPELQTARADALKAAGAALDAAEKAGADVVEIVRYVDKAKAPAMDCPKCKSAMSHEGKGAFKCAKCGGAFAPAKKSGDAPAPAAPPVTDPLAIAKANYEQMVKEAEAAGAVEDGASLYLDGDELARYRDDAAWHRGNLAALSARPVAAAK